MRPPAKAKAKAASKNYAGIDNYDQTAQHQHRDNNYVTTISSGNCQRLCSP